MVPVQSQELIRSHETAPLQTRNARHPTRPDSPLLRPPSSQHHDLPIDAPIHHHVPQSFPHSTATTAANTPTTPSSTPNTTPITTQNSILPPHHHHQQLSHHSVQQQHHHHQQQQSHYHQLQQQQHHLEMENAPPRPDSPFPQIHHSHTLALSPPLDHEHQQHEHDLEQHTNSTTTTSTTGTTTTTTTTPPPSTLSTTPTTTPPPTTTTLIPTTTSPSTSPTHPNFANEPYIQPRPPPPDDDLFNVCSDVEDRIIDVSSLDAIYSVQKMAEVLVVGPDSEREFILFELQQLLDHCLEDTMKILIPVLCKHVPTWNIDLQIKAAQRLFDVVCLKLEPAVANMITCASFGVIHGSKGCAAPEYEELYNLWGGLLVDCLPNMEWSPQEIKDVLTLVDIHSNESYTSRKVAARVIGALAQCLDKTKVEKIILPRALKLFDDTDVNVRGTVVESLANIGAALPLRTAEAVVWPRVESLLEPPEEARIRATAMRTMAHILEAHRGSSSSSSSSTPIANQNSNNSNNCNSRLYRELLPPVFNRLAMFARKFSAEDQRLVHDDTYLILEVVSEVFGQFAYSLSLVNKKQFRKEAYKAYAGMATCNAPLIRRNCAYNLPGVAKALGDRYALELSGVCDFLASDMDDHVRAIVAAGIHETAQLLAPRGDFERLFGAVCALLQDESPTVRMNALTHFYDLLTAFAKDGNDPASLRRLAPVFANLTMLSEGVWRIQKSLAEQLGQCADIIPADALMDNVLPLLFRLTNQGTPLVREAAMNATARSLRRIPMRERHIAIEKYWRAAAKGPFWMRLALLDGGAAAMNVFSHKGFLELFATDMLRLSNDPVPNVRIRVASLMAKMAPACIGTTTYDKALETLRNDEDEDVSEIMRKHDENARIAMKEARDKQNLDHLKYKEEQEFYGQSKPAKRARGRGGVNHHHLHHHQSKPNRLIMVTASRRPSLDQSSENLSASKAVVAAAKATSMMASEMKPTSYAMPRVAASGHESNTVGGGGGIPPYLQQQQHHHHHHLDENAAGVGPSGMVGMVGTPDGVQVEGEGIIDDHHHHHHHHHHPSPHHPMYQHYHPQHAMLGDPNYIDVATNGVMVGATESSGTTNSTSLGLSPGDDATSNSSRSANTDLLMMNGNVPVMQQQRASVNSSNNNGGGGAHAARYEARSKSWNGIIPQLPRQLSMEGRQQRRNAGKHGKNGNSANDDGSLTTSTTIVGNNVHINSSTTSTKDDANKGNNNNSGSKQQQGNNTGWSLSKRKPSRLRGKKKRNNNGNGNNRSSVVGVPHHHQHHMLDDSNMSEASISTDVTDVSVDVVEYSSSAAAMRRSVAARAKSMVQQSSTNVTATSNTTNSNVDPNAHQQYPHQVQHQQEHPSTGHTEMSGGGGGGFGSGGRKSSGGPALFLGKGKRKDNKEKEKDGGSGYINSGAVVTTSYDKDSGLPSYKGNAPWERPKKDDEDLDALSKAVHRMEFGNVPTTTVSTMAKENSNAMTTITSNTTTAALNNRPPSPSLKVAGGGGGGGGGPRPGTGAALMTAGTTPATSTEFSIVPGGPDAGGTQSSNVSIDSMASSHNTSQFGVGGSGGGNGSGGNGRFLRGLFRRRR